MTDSAFYGMGAAADISSGSPYQGAKGFTQICYTYFAAASLGCPHYRIGPKKGLGYQWGQCWLFHPLPTPICPTHPHHCPPLPLCQMSCSDLLSAGAHGKAQPSWHSCCGHCHKVLHGAFVTVQMSGALAEHVFHQCTNSSGAECLNSLCFKVLW